MPSFKDHQFYEVTCDQIYDSTKLTHSGKSLFPETKENFLDQKEILFQQRSKTENVTIKVKVKIR